MKRKIKQHRDRHSLPKGKKIPSHLFYERDLVRLHLVGWKDKHFPPRPESDKANANWKRRKDASNIFWSLAAWLEFEGLWISLASALAHSRAFCAPAVCRFLLPCNVLSAGPGEVTAYLIDGALTLGNIQITSRLAGVGGSQQSEWRGRAEDQGRAAVCCCFFTLPWKTIGALCSPRARQCAGRSPLSFTPVTEWLDSNYGSSACHEYNRGSIIKNLLSVFCFLSQ